MAEDWVDFVRHLKTHLEDCLRMQDLIQQCEVPSEKRLLVRALRRMQVSLIYDIDKFVDNLIHSSPI